MAIISNDEEYENVEWTQVNDIDDGPRYMIEIVNSIDEYMTGIWNSAYFRQTKFLKISRNFSKFV